MARQKDALKATIVSGHELRSRAKKVEYNVQKLSDKSVVVPKASPAKKKAAALKKVVGNNKKPAKKGKKTGATYIVLVTRALKGVEAPGISVHKIVAWLDKHYPDKQDRKHVLAALNLGVEKKNFVKAKGSYRLSKKAQDAMKKKKAAKKATTKKTTTKKTIKKTTKKKTTTKKATTKKSTTKKPATKKKAATTKKTTTKKAPKSKRASSDEGSESPAKTPTKKAKKVIGPPAGDEQPTGEARGQWQYYDNGWFDYTADSSRVVEGVFQEYSNDNTGLEVRPIQSGHFKYQVNFKTLEQTNTETGTMRKIRRV